MVKFRGLTGIAALLLAMGLSSADQAEVQTTSAIATLRTVGPGIQVREDQERPVVRFLSAPPGSSIPTSTQSPDAEVRLRAFLRNNKNAFLSQNTPLEFVTPPGTAAPAEPVGADELGFTRVRLPQAYRGVPVRFGEISALLDDRGVRALTSTLVSGLEALPVNPGIPPEQATAVVRQHLLKLVGPQQVDVSAPVLEFVDPAILSGRSGVPRLVWYVEVTGTDLWRQYWIDAGTAELILTISKVTEARNRVTYDANNSASVPSTPVRVETTPPSGIADVDAAHDYAADFYNYFMTEHARDSWDGRGGQIISVARMCDPAFGCPMQNAFWNGSRVAYGQGFVIDDIVAHELTHGVIQATADMVYQNEPGALNESFADIFGETVDLTNGKGQDGASDRWVMGEQLSGRTGIRDMMNPSRYADPEKVTDNSYVCGTQDNGGVHTNSGVPNHAYALMVDGGSYNGYSITGIGLVKAGKVHYRALSRYMTTTSNFQAAHDALVQSCSDLVGTSGITANDCAQVKNALLAVEMTTRPCSSQLPPPLPASPPSPTPPAGAQLCGNSGQARVLFSDDFENSGSGNWSNQALSGVNHWNGGSGNPPIYFSTTPYSGTLSLYGAGRAGIGDSVVAMTGAVAVGSGAAMQFVSQFNFEDGYDGGVLEYSTNNGSSWQDAGSLISAGRNYTGSIVPGSDNPLGGRTAFTGNSGGYVVTRLALDSLAGRSVMFRFRAGTDQLVASPGWYIDDVQIYECGVNTAPVATGQSRSVNEDQNLALTLSATDADGDPLTYRIASSPVNGSVTGTAPNVVYRPNLNFNGQDSFTFVANDGVIDSTPATVSIQVLPVNDPPVAAGKTVSLNEDSTANVTLSASDPDGTALTYRLVGLPAFGNAVLSGSTVTYSPAQNFNGQDSFQYVANDGTIDSQPATVNLTVIPVNDRPVALSQSLSTGFGQAVSGVLQGTDVDQNALTYSIVLAPAGTLTGTLPSFTYTPPSGFSGVDEFVFVVNDGTLDSLEATVTISVGESVGNQPPTAQSLSLSTAEDVPVNINLVGADPEGSSLSYSITSTPAKGSLGGSGNQLIYTPNPNYFGADSFTYRVSDGVSFSNPATVSINITPVNDAPVAGGITVSTLQSTPVSISFAGSDVEGDALSYSIYQQPQGGVLQSTSAVSVTYVPNSGFIGTDTFQYVASDGNRTSLPAVVTVNVTASGSGGNGAGQGGVVITPQSGLVTTEAGGMASFTVVLTNPPQGQVVLNLESSDPTEGLVLQSRYIFTQANWFVPQTVEIIGLSDRENDGDVGYWIITSPLQSTDPSYNGLNPPDLAVVNRQTSNESLVQITPVNGLATTEYGGVAQFSVSLGQQPEAGIILYLASSDASEGRVVPESISFTRNDWATKKVITVTGVDDDVQDGDIHFSIVTQPLVSLDPRFAGFDPPDVRVTNADNETGRVAGAMSPLFGLFLVMFFLGMFPFRSITGKISV